MSAPFDLSEALKTPPSALNTKTGGRGGGRRPPVNVRLDEAARKVIWIALTVCVLLGGYLLFGLFAPQSHWANGANQGWQHQTHAFRSLQLSNISMVSGILQFAAIVLIAAMLVVFYNDEGAGYTLLGVAAVIYVGIPLLANWLFPLQALRSSDATQKALQEIQSLGLIFGVPGLIWSVVEVGRRFQAAAEVALVKQANAKYAEASAARSLGAKVPGRKLTRWQRQQRTYQILSVFLIVGEISLVLLNLSTIQGWMGGLLGLMNRLSFSSSPTGLAQLQGSDGNFVLWTLLIALDLVILSQLLRLLEYLCYRNVS
jgi:hypothetical protein